MTSRAPESSPSIHPLIGWRARLESAELALISRPTPARWRQAAAQIRATRQQHVRQLQPARSHGQTPLAISLWRPGLLLEACVCEMLL